MLPGADESQVMIGVITAFLDQIRPRHSPVVVDLLPAKQRLGLASGPDSLPGEDLDFGPMRILGSGQALFMGSSSGAAVPTATTWVQEVDMSEPDPSRRIARYYVVDSTPYVLVKAQLDALPAGHQRGHARFKPASSLKALLASIPSQSAHRPSAWVAGHSASGSGGSPFTSQPHPMAIAKAGAKPRRGLLLDYIIAHNHLLNIHFGGTNSAGGTADPKVGPAAVGQSANDYWNPWYYPSQSSVTVTNLVWADATASSVGVTVNNAPGDWGNGAADPMMSTYMYAHHTPATSPSR